ncbi:MAG: DUF302 domain-containing protein [Candidatus Acidiferrales bacterium]
MNSVQRSETAAGTGVGELHFGPSDYLAAERTFLAWIRTGIALMGFGFVVARFGLFLQEFQFAQANIPRHSSWLSLFFGTALIAIGVIVNVFSTWAHVRLVRAMNRGGASYKSASSLAIAVALVLAAIGVALAFYVTLVRGPEGVNSGIIEEKTMSANVDNGIVSRPSIHSVDETVAKLKAMLESKGVKIFVVVDHSGEAANAGLKMPATKLVIFGNPKAGTPLMLAAPSVAIDLPLKILVAEDEGGKVTLSYNSAEYLQRRHGFPADLMGNLAVVDALATNAGK